ncbi:MAG: VOC family protein [Pseudomonadota bacterium]|nr:VOC family protein [Pseudomonadota bacterium]
MIGYVTVGTNNKERAAKFYDTLFQEMGAQRVFSIERIIGWGIGTSQPWFCIAEPYNGKEATIGNGDMTALKVQSKDDVNSLYAKAMELGAKDEGPPGDRDDGFYGGYFRDLDGNKLVFFTIIS